MKKALAPKGKLHEKESDLDLMSFHDFDDPDTVHVGWVITRVPGGGDGERRRSHQNPSAGESLVGHVEAEMMVSAVGLMRSPRWGNSFERGREVRGRSNSHLESHPELRTRNVDGPVIRDISAELLVQESALGRTYANRPPLFVEKS